MTCGCCHDLLRIVVVVYYYFAYYLVRVVAVSFWNLFLKCTVMRLKSVGRLQGEDLVRYYYLLVLQW